MHSTRDIILNTRNTLNVLNHFVVNDSHHDICCIVPSSYSPLQHLHANETWNARFPNSYNSRDFARSGLVMYAGNVPALCGRQLYSCWAWHHQSMTPKMIFLYHLFVWKPKLTFYCDSHMANKCSPGLKCSHLRGTGFRASVLKAVTLNY